MKKNSQNLQQLINEDRTILVIDQDELNQTLLEHIFREFDHIEMLFASSKDEAEDYLDIYPTIDLMIIEPLLPDVNGFEFMYQLKKYFNNTPIIALTVCAFSHEEVKCYKYGCDVHIAKPFLTDQLISTVNALLN